MRISKIGVLLLALSAGSQAAMVPSNTIGNNPQKEQLCATRAKIKPVPFEIDPEYVKRVRELHPDATFVAEDGLASQLIQCMLRPGTGRFEQDSSMPEGQVWRLPKPAQFKPSVNTNEGMALAAKACLFEASTKLVRPNLDHTVPISVQEVQKQSRLYPLGKMIGGAKVERYDVVVTGKAFYKSQGPDLDAVEFTCLFTPMLEQKGFATK